MASALSNKLSREDFKKAKELEELRKTGAAPPELDEDGKMINPHIPQYVSQAPWYLNQTRPGLKHQYNKAFRDKEKMDDIGSWYTRGKTIGKAKKFRKGACENCGSMTHTTKECTERPRRRGAALTGKNIGADEIVQSFKLDYDGKRDRWNGYNPATYTRVIEHYEKTDAARRKAKQKELDKRFKQKKKEKMERRAKQREQRREKRKKKKEAEKKKRADAKFKKKERAMKKAAGEEVSEGDSDDSGDESDEPDSLDDTDTDTDTDTDNDTDTDDEDELDEDDMKDTGAMFMSRAHGAKHTTNQTTARNLRIREDTAKYLRNLNVNSAYYDPKTRAMRANPHPDKDPKELMYAGDNFVRGSGDVGEVDRLRSFVWEANSKGNEGVHMLSNPSQAEFLYEQYQMKKESLKKNKKTAVLEKYGGAEHLKAPARELLVGESEAYVEYAETGEVLRGQEKAVPSTRYTEHVLESNHTEIWGSFFNGATKLWGFACCHQTTRAAYCTGDVGREAITKVADDMYQKMSRLGGGVKRKAPPVPAFGEEDKRSKGGEDDEDDGIDHEKLRRALAAEKEEDHQAAIREAKARKGYSMSEEAPLQPSEKDLEKFRKSMPSVDDPMQNFNSDELLPM